MPKKLPLKKRDTMAPVPTKKEPKKEEPNEVFIQISRPTFVKIKKPTFKEEIIMERSNENGQSSVKSSIHESESQTGPIRGWFIQQSRYSRPSTSERFLKTLQEQ